jgi:hypothetical protein
LRVNVSTKGFNFLLLGKYALKIYMDYMIPKGISQTTIPNPKYIRTLKKKITNSRLVFVVLIWKYESPVLLKFHNSSWKYGVPYANSCMAASSSAQNIIIPERTL